MARKRRHKTSPKNTSACHIRIDDLGARGDGVGIVDNDAIHVPFTAPGDVVDVEWNNGRWESCHFHAKSDKRREPPCQYCGVCGGCALQHVSEQYYRSWKFERVASAVVKAGFTGTSIEPMICIASNSRRRALFAIRKHGTQVLFGFHQRGSRTIVDIDSCLVLDPALATMLPGLKSLSVEILNAFPAASLHATACDNGVDVNITGDIDADDLTYHQRDKIAAAARESGIIRLGFHGEPLAMFSQPMISFGDVDVAIPPGAFLQATRKGEDVMRNLVVAECASANSIADLFSGCGTFALPLSRQARVEAFDSDRLAVAALNIAASQANRSANGNVRNLFINPMIPEELSDFDAIVFDPPRAGAEAQSIQIAKSHTPLVFGVSCNPTTFLRDAKILRDGGYTLTSVTPIDQFIYSPHIEVVGVFRRL